MIFHVLNGDALNDRFIAAGLNGEIIIMRECLISGDLTGDDLHGFFSVGEDYLTRAYGDKSDVSYMNKVASQINKLLVAPDNSEFNLWFGHDLFCQVNMWFILSILKDISIRKRVFIVYPSHLTFRERWDDFGYATSENLKAAFDDRISLTSADIALGDELWSAYKSNNTHKLTELSKTHSTAFPYLKEVCQAQIRHLPLEDSKPPTEQVLEEIIQEHENNFSEVFKIYTSREAVYGFGDLQAKQLFEKINRNKK